MALTKQQRDLVFTSFLIANKGLGTPDKLLQEAFDTLLLPRQQQIAKMKTWVQAFRAAKQNQEVVFDSEAAMTKAKLQADIAALLAIEDNPNL